MKKLNAGELALMDRLRNEANEIAMLGRRLNEHKRRRNLLITKARVAGFTVREIEKLAGVSNVRVSQIVRPT